MPVDLHPPQVSDLHAIPGVRIGVTQGGVRKAGRKDVTVFLLDEGTAVVVHGNVFSVVGVSKVAIYDANYLPGPDGKPYYFLNPGDCFDIAKRRRAACAD